MNKFVEKIRELLGIDKVNVIDMTDLYAKKQMIFVPNNIVIKFPSLSDRIKTIPYRDISEDMLYDIFENSLKEINRRKGQDV